MHGNFINNNRKNDCKCCSSGSAVIESTDSKKILNYIMSDDTLVHYGVIYYDIDKDMIFFRNREGIEHSLFSKGRNISINDSCTNSSLNTMLFNGDWKKNSRYSCNNIVKFDDSFWICKNNLMNSTNDPKQDKNNWNLLIPNVSSEKSFTQSSVSNINALVPIKSSGNNVIVNPKHIFKRIEPFPSELNSASTCDSNCNSYSSGFTLEDSAFGDSVQETDASINKNKESKKEDSDNEFNVDSTKELKKMMVSMNKLKGKLKKKLILLNSNEKTCTTDCILNNDIFNSESDSSESDKHNKKTYNIHKKSGMLVTQSDNTDDNDNIKIWRIGKVYTINSIVFFENKLYKCIKINTSSSNNNPSLIKNSLWISLNSEIEKDNSNKKSSVFYGFVVNNDNRYMIDSKTKVSVANDSMVDLQSNPQDTNISSQSEFFDKLNYEIQMLDFVIGKTKLKKYTKFKIPINCVGKNSADKYDYIECNKNIFIVKKGCYKITYNIAFKGTFDKFTSYINMNVDNQQDLNQICASEKTLIIDKDDINYVNHYFILPIDNNNSNRIDLVCDMVSKSKTNNHELSILPIKTWIFIESID